MNKERRDMVGGKGRDTYKQWSGFGGKALCSLSYSK